jgi:hypothetical protein
MHPEVIRAESYQIMLPSVTTRSAFPDANAPSILRRMHMHANSAAIKLIALGYPSETHAIRHDSFHMNRMS